MEDKTATSLLDVHTLYNSAEKIKNTVVHCQKMDSQATLNLQKN
jgi:hypothetical protein